MTYDSDQEMVIIFGGEKNFNSHITNNKALGGTWTFTPHEIIKPYQVEELPEIINYNLGSLDDIAFNITTSNATTYDILLNNEFINSYEYSDNDTITLDLNSIYSNFTFANNTVTRSWGTATAKAHADTLYTQQDDTDGLIPDGKDVGDVKVKGLKTILIEELKQQVANELAKTDWYITRKTEKTTAIPSAISTHRDAVRTKQAEMETAITNATDTPALETLYTYTTDDDGNTTRPLGELPTLES